VRCRRTGRESRGGQNEDEEKPSRQTAGVRAGAVMGAGGLPPREVTEEMECL
jgi:hypothetical protein